MAEIAGFFDNISYSAADMNAFLAVKTAKDGVVFGYLNNMALTNAGSQTTNFDTGGVVFGGMIYRNTTSASLISTTVTSGKMRVDVFVVRFNSGAGSANLTIIQGVEATSNPATPAITSATDVLIGKLLIDRTSGTVYTLTDQRDWFIPSSNPPTTQLNQLLLRSTGGLPKMSWISTTSFSVGIGALGDSTFVDSLFLSSALTKTTSSWVVGSSVGGKLSAAAMANNTIYGIYLIKRIDTGVVDTGFDVNLTTPTLPANYTLFRRIGYLRTDGSANFLAFDQTNNFIQLRARILDLNAVASTNTRTLANSSAPKGTVANYAAIDTAGGNIFIKIGCTNETDVASSIANADLAASTSSYGQVNKNILIDSNQQFYYRSDVNGSNLSAQLLGWYDFI